MFDNTIYFPEKTQKIEHVWNAQDPYTVTDYVLPTLANLLIVQTKDYINCVDELERVQELAKEILSSDEAVVQEIASLEFEGTSSTIYKALTSTEAVLEELTYGSYSKESKHEYARWVLTLFLNHLSCGAVLEQRKIDTFKKDLFESKQTLLEPRSEEESNNPSFILTLEQSEALLKIAKNPMEASHKLVIEEFPLYQVHTHELAGYETDALLGFGRTPETIKIAVTTPKNEEKVVVVQKMIPKCKALYDLYVEPNTGNILKNLDKADVHVTIVAGIIRGMAAGHFGNYGIDEQLHLKEFDLKECFIPFNRIPKNFRVLRQNVEDLDLKKEQLQKLFEETSDLDEKIKIQDQLDKLVKRLETERKSIVMARMHILGLPQCDKPFEKALLMVLAHPSLQSLIQAHHTSIRDKKYHIDASALDAQLERLTLLQELALSELGQEIITLTPRKAFYAIFGGEELFDLAIKKGYCPITIFNNIIGSAYRHEFEDLSQPETMKGRSTEKPSSESVAAKNFFDNMKTLYAEE